MQAYQRDFIRFAIERGVLRFGEFTLKSGRSSPYFFNAGLFNDGARLGKLAWFYARRLIDSGLPFTFVNRKWDSWRRAAIRWFRFWNAARCHQS